MLLSAFSAEIERFSVFTPRALYQNFALYTNTFSLISLKLFVRIWWSKNQLIAIVGLLNVTFHNYTLRIIFVRKYLKMLLLTLNYTFLLKSGRGSRSARTFIFWDFVTQVIDLLLGKGQFLVPILAFFDPPYSGQWFVFISQRTLYAKMQKCTR